MKGDMRAQGFRYVFTGKAWKWVHPAEVKPENSDCTDMTDSEFEAFWHNAVYGNPDGIAEECNGD